MGSPPLARGVLSKVCCIVPGVGITPACAGSTIESWRLSVRMKDHPRLRGEYFSKQNWYRLYSGSPPLARGVPLLKNSYNGFPGITPACAGSTLPIDFIGPITKDHPRLRGEYSETFAFALPPSGSPPLARGVRQQLSDYLRVVGITPACAGSTGSGGCVAQEN